MSLKGSHALVVYVVNTLYERRQFETVLEHTIIYTWVNPIAQHSGAEKDIINIFFNDIKRKY